MTKAEIRKIYLDQQKNLSSAERTQKSKQISNQFFQKFDLSRINFLHCFLPIEKFSEVDTSLIFNRLWREFPNIQTLVPHVDFQANEIESLKFTPQTKLVKNVWEIDEPTTGETVAADKIDLVLVPLLSFDERGFRVGYGKGFYDRFLRKCRADCLKIGLSYFAPVAEVSDARGFDVKLDFCVTSEELFTTKTRRTQSIKRF